jgi:hypothetical protein
MLKAELGYDNSTILIRYFATLYLIEKFAKEKRVELDIATTNRKTVAIPLHQ